MPNKNVPVQGNVSGAPITSSTPTASSGYSGQLANPTMRTWPVDTSLPPGDTYNNGLVASQGNNLASYLSFGSSLLGAGLGFLGNKFMFDSQVAEQQRRERWQMQWRDNERAYNSPAMQVQRLNEAGLNGKLLLSQQGLSQGQTAPQNGSVSPSMDASGPASVLAQGGATAANLMMQQKLMQAQVDNIEAQTNKTQAETMLLPEQLRGMSMSNDTYSATQRDIIKQTRLQSIKQLAENRITDATARIQEIQADVIERFGHRNAEWNFKILDQEYQKIKEEVVNLLKQGANIDADTLVKKTQSRLNKALEGYYKEETKLTKSKIALTDAETNYTNAKFTGQVLTNNNTPRLSKDDRADLAAAMVAQAAAEAVLSGIEIESAKTTWQNTIGNPESYTTWGAAFDSFITSSSKLLGGNAGVMYNGRLEKARTIVKGFK